MARSLLDLGGLLGAVGAEALAQELLVRVLPKLERGRAVDLAAVAREDRIVRLFSFLLQNLVGDIALALHGLVRGAPFHCDGRSG